MDVVKQLIVNRLLDSSDLQNIVKSFIFYDIETAKTRRKKRGLINNLKLGLSYNNVYTAYWTLSYRYEIAINSANCVCCGNYYSNADTNQTITCVCDADYVDTMLNYIYMKRNELKYKQ